MALIVKTAPKGVDAKLDQLQRHLYTNLSWTNYESYHRGYRNPEEGNFIPEVYTANGEYKEVFFNDNFAATSYFLVDEETPIEKRGIKATVSLYYQIKLDQIEPDIPHRADEEIKNEVLYWINKAGLGIKAESVITGIPNVYSGLKQDQVTFDNMGNFFVFRVILDFPIIMPDFCPGVIVPVCAVATIIDSDGVTPFEVASGGAGACTLAVSPSGIAYSPPQQTGQWVSGYTYDDGWQAQNGTYDYTPPVYPVSYAKLDMSVGTEGFVTLIDNNAFGNKFRLTGKTGGYRASNNNYRDVDGNATTLALAFPDDYIIDHYTGLGYYAIQLGNPVKKTLVNAMNDTAVLNIAGFSDWRVLNRSEKSSVIRVTDSDNTGSVRMSYDPWADLNTAAGITQNRDWWISTRSSNSGLYYRSGASATIAVANAIVASYGYYIVRNHYT